jgi:hypothetical protein
MACCFLLSTQTFQLLQWRVHTGYREVANQEIAVESSTFYYWLLSPSTLVSISGTIEKDRELPSALQLFYVQPGQGSQTTRAPYLQSFQFVQCYVEEPGEVEARIVRGWGEGG